jgi:hypothetical protein
MKSSKTRSLLIYIAALSLGSAGVSSAALAWDTVSGNSTADGGTGVWDLVTPNWYNGTSNVAWDSSDAVFGVPLGGIARIAVPSGGITARSITFSVNNKIISDETDGDLSDDFLYVEDALELVVPQPGSGIESAITGPGSLLITAPNAFSFRLEGANTYAGGTIVEQASVNAASLTAFGPGEITLNGLISFGNAPAGSIQNNITVVGASHISLIPGQSLAGNLSVQQQLTIVTYASWEDRGIADITGPILGGSAGSKLILRASSGSALRITTAQPFAGPITLESHLILGSNGNLENSSFTIEENSILSGTGTAGSVLSRSGARISPGENGIGTLGIGNLTGHFFIDTELGQSADRLDVHGNVQAGGMGFLLTFLDDFDPAVGDLFFLLTNDGTDLIEASFFSMGTGSNASYIEEGRDIHLGGYILGFTPNADFETQSFSGGNDIAIKVLPEPSSTLLLGMAGVLLQTRRRHRRV